MLTMNRMTIERGNTVRFVTKFTGFDGLPTEPDTALFKIYDRKFNELLSAEMTKAQPTEDDPKVGVYYYYYTPDADGEYTVEMYGIVDNNPVVTRRKVNVVFDDTSV